MHLTIDAVVRDEKIDIDDPDVYRVHATRAARRWGEGARLKIRIEPEEDAATYAQKKYYWGYVVTPFSDETGYHKHEVHEMLKLECMPEGFTSITELNYRQMADYSAAAEQTARAWCPDAFLLYDNTR